MAILQSIAAVEKIPFMSRKTSTSYLFFASSPRLRICERTCIASPISLNATYIAYSGRNTHNILKKTM